MTATSKYSAVLSLLLLGAIIASVPMLLATEQVYRAADELQPRADELWPWMTEVRLFSAESIPQKNGDTNVVDVAFSAAGQVAESAVSIAYLLFKLTFIPATIIFAWTCFWRWRQRRKRRFRQRLGILPKPAARW